tara:strand:- start:468 stop:797 length:330 start_codon:yes stop_codon:yes gene_type:complete
MNLQNFPNDLPKAKYFGASSQNCGWAGGYNNWAYMVESKFQDPQQKLALYGEQFSTQDKHQVAVAKTTDGKQYVPDTKQTVNNTKIDFLEGLETTETPNPLLAKTAPPF